MKNSFFRRIDKPILIIYFLFLVFGWICIYEASFVGDAGTILDFSDRSSMQLLWIGVSVVAATVILSTNINFYDSFAYLIYGAVVVLLIITLFVAPNIKGSHSWIVIGGVSLQPAEFAKFATALALAKLFSTNDFKLQTWSQQLFPILLILLLPVVIILLQKETGTTLVFLSFVLMLYREGLSPFVLMIGAFFIAFFIIIIYSTSFTGADFTENVGVFICLNIIVLSAIFLFNKYISNRNNFKLSSLVLLSVFSGVYIISYLVSYFLLKFDFLYISIFLVALLIVYLVLNIIEKPKKSHLTLLLIVLLFASYSFSIELIFEKVLEPHQRTRIETLFGIREDPMGAEWNSIQSKIAISSGRVLGKGFLKGTQTKLKFVPEQDTDFIFCTIAEELGFWGSSLVVILFVAFIVRLIYLCERQTNIFYRVYGYGVAGIFLFHFFINIGMVLGIMPIIGIPLPFFSYGGSSLLGFTILLFIFVKMDMSSKVNI